MNKPRFGFKFCVYGGQFGSEGKGCVAEWLIRQFRTTDKLVVFGENAPNSGHTSTKGKTRSLPVSAYDADVVMLGPDAAIDPVLLATEIRQIRLKNPKLTVYVHENAATITEADLLNEKSSGLGTRISSTMTGGGSARTNKAMYRQTSCIIRQASHFSEFEVVDRVRWMELVYGFEDQDCLFECSQGLMLDLNLGYYPYVTSRTTHPRAAIERNGLGPSSDWSFIGVYRSYPIRTGGPSGPTGGKELTWQQIGVKDEIATVTGRVRRVFEFSGADFLYSLQLVRPNAVAFTHLDYLPVACRSQWGFVEWLGKVVGLGQSIGSHPNIRKLVTITSDAPAMFTYHGELFLTPRKEDVEQPNPFCINDPAVMV